jgi:beta-phosphoglucomutase
VIKGCIFDLDGVIVDTAHYHYLAWRRLADELGHNLTKEENEELKGVSRMRSLEIVLEKAGISLNQQHKEILAEKKNTWFNEYVQQMQPEEIFPGVKALIRNMRGRGIKVGLASSSRNARTVVRLLNIHNEFDAIVDGTMIARTKPDPEIFLKTAQLMGIEPADCVVVEDAEAGVEAALAAGMKCIGIGSEKILYRADRVFPKTSEVRLSTLDELVRN